MSVRVLVVDDDADVRGTVADALAGDGFEVLTAANGLEALNALRDAILPDMILLDMMMPEMDGPAFRAEQLKQPALARIPVVVFTAYGVPRETAERLGAHGYLKKPTRLDDLLRTVRRFTRRSQGPPGPGG